MEREDFVHVLRRFHELLGAGGVMLDLQVIRPDPVVEVGGTVVCEIDGEPLLAAADAAAAEVDALVASGLLAEEAVDDHDVCKHYGTGAELVEDFAGKQRKIPEDAIPLLVRIERECVVRER